MPLGVVCCLDVAHVHYSMLLDILFTGESTLFAARDQGSADHLKKLEHHASTVVELKIDAQVASWVPWSRFFGV